jgi:hypothetical protein
MNARTKERVERWESRPCSGGYEGLRELADSDFTGAAESGGTWLFMLNGRVVGVYEGSIEDFEDASGTAHVAPDPALPLLFAMWEEGGETQGKYYTEDTTVADVDETLTSGSFTGYLELSENVLSGDYYVVYYGGRSMSAAFVGNSEDLVGGDEAFERANDEVGIYEVKDVDIDVIDIPEPETEDDEDEEPAEQPAPGGADSEPTAGGAGTAGSSPADASVGPADFGSGREEPSEQRSASPDSPTRQDTVDQEPSPSRSKAPQNDDVVGAPAAGDDVSDDAVPEEEEMDSVFDRLKEQASDPDEPAPDAPETELSTSDVVDSTETDPTDDLYGSDSGVTSGTSGASTESRSSDAGASGQASGTDAHEDNHSGSPTGQPSDSAAGGATSTSPSDQSDDGASQGEVTVIPSLDPERSTSLEDDATPETETGGATTQATATGATASDRSTTAAPEPSTTQTNADPRASQQSAGPTKAEVRERIEKRDDRIEELESAIEQVREERDRLQRERDQFEADNDSLREEVSRLEGQVEQLEAEVQQLEAALADAGKTAYDATTQLSPAEAIAATNLFVRYRSKGDATLAAARDGNADADEVNSNVRLETHTQFDAGEAAVEGEPFESYLEGTLEYQFVTWVVETLLYEIRDSGHAGGLQGLYEAIPEIDRAELGGDVDIVYTENGEEITEQATFDVVLRNRMGNPLIVADLNDSRDPASESMLVELESAASSIKQVNDELSAAFLVTSSFFEPGALEAAAEATSGSLLSRDSRESFVKLSRKQGYHLCLVEARANDFHVNVPEL